MKIIRLLTVALLAIVFYLPANPVIAKDLPVLRAVPALAIIPANGSWTGTTNLGKSMSFSVQSGGAQWSTFKLATSYVNGGCSLTMTSTVPGPGSIVNGQFSWTGSSFAFTGNFTSETTASGTYTYTNQSSGCGTFSQSGTWTAAAQPVFVPADGNWTGTTNLSKSMSFSVQSGGAQWNTFELTTSYTNGGCSVIFTTTVPGPGSIVDGQFSWSGTHFAFTGNFTSELTALGTYTYTNQSTGCGTFSQSGTWTASIPLPAPTSFEKSTPINGASSQPLSLNLIWGSSTWASAYEYCYDTTNNNICDGGWIDNGTGLSASIGGLNAGTTYYWQVKANNSSGTVYADGNETAWWSFSTEPPPGSFGKVGPSDMSINQPTNPTLSWNTSTGATSYEYCYDTTNDSACTGSWISTGSNTSIGLSGLTTNTTYYWQVRAVNTGGTTYANAGAWWSFTTLNDIRIYLPLVIR